MATFMCNIYRHNHTVKNFIIKNGIEEILSKHMVSRKCVLSQNLSYAFDVVKSIGFLYNHYQKHRNCKYIYPKYLFLEELCQIVDSGDYNQFPLWSQMNKLQQNLSDYFLLRDINYFNKLFWIENPEFLFENLLMDSNSLNIKEFYKDDNVNYQSIFDFGSKTSSVISSNKHTGLMKLILIDDLFDHLMQNKSFGLTMETITSIHDRKYRLDIPNFGKTPSNIRTVSFTNIGGILGFSVCGGKLICTSDDRYYEEFKYCPVFVESVSPNSFAFNSGLVTGDKIVGINFTNIQGLDLDVISHILTKTLEKGKCLTLSVVYSPEELKISETLVQFYQNKKKEFDPEPLSDHPSDIARRNKRPPWRMIHNKKIKYFHEKLEENTDI